MQGRLRLGVYKNKVMIMIFGPKRYKVTGVEKDYITRSFMPCMFIVKYYSGDPIKKNRMGGACDKCVGHERCIQGFGRETWVKETTWKS
jgi:hypothetical protein